MLAGFLNSYRNCPQSIALVLNGKTFTYHWLYEQSSGIAAALLEMKSPGEFVGIYTDNNEYTYAAILGALMAGKGFVPLNHKFPDDRLRKISDDAGLNLILGCERSNTRINLIKSSGALLIDAIKPIVGFKVNEFAGHKNAYVLFTSGSTGVPKGIPITSSNFEALINALRIRYKLSGSDKVLQAFELSFDVSLACTFLAWEFGCALVVVDVNGIVAVNAFKTIYDNEVTFVTLPPSAIHYLKRLKILGNVKTPSVHTTLFTGEALPYQLTLDWKETAENSVIENAYGPTETTVWCLFYLLDDATKDQTINGLCPIGVGLNGIDCRIVDSENNVVPLGSRGELLVSGTQIFEGYWRNLKKSEEAFFVDQDDVKWYRTGDIVSQNAKGNIVYINRKDNQVQINGYRVELGEVEFAIKSASGIDGVVVLDQVTQGIPSLVAFLENEFDEARISAALREKLPAYMVPHRFVQVKSLPINTNGKVDKQSLRKAYLDNA